MDMSELLTQVMILLGVLALVGLAVIALVMWRYHLPPRGLIAMIGALVYLVSPLDVLPEALLGPVGLLDDAGAATAVVVVMALATRQFVLSRKAPWRLALAVAVLDVVANIAMLYAFRDGLLSVVSVVISLVTSAAAGSCNSMPAIEMPPSAAHSSRPASYVLPKSLFMISAATVAPSPNSSLIAVHQMADSVE